MTLKNTLTFSAIAAAIFITAFLLAGAIGAKLTHASAPSGLFASLKAPISVLASTTPGMVLATTTCNARIVATSASPILLSFSDAFTPTGSVGIYQPASTTVAYDSGQYGCGAVRMYSYTTGLVTLIDAQ